MESTETNNATLRILLAREGIYYRVLGRRQSDTATVFAAYSEESHKRLDELWRMLTNSEVLSANYECVQIIVDSANVVYAPADAVERWGGEDILASAEMSPRNGETVLMGKNLDGVVALWPMNKELMELLERHFAGCASVEYHSPLHRNIDYVNSLGRIKNTLVVVNFTRDNIYYLRVGRGGVLQVVAAYPYEGIADAVYIISTISCDAELSKERYAFLGGLPEQDKFFLKRNFKRSVCE